MRFIPLGEKKVIKEIANLKRNGANEQEIFKQERTLKTLCYLNTQYYGDDGKRRRRQKWTKKLLQTSYFA